MNELPPALVAHPELDTWIRFGPGRTVTAFTGKVELGQGLVSALSRIVAEELDVRIERVRIETADTAHGLNELVTAGSTSMSDSGSALRQAAAEARAHLLDLAAARLGQSGAELVVNDGVVSSTTGGDRVSYWELLGGRRFDRKASGRAVPKPANAHRIVGDPRASRSDLRDIVTGTTCFVHDLTIPGMLHGRVARPPSPHATLDELDDTPVRDMDGVVEVVRNGSFVGAVAVSERAAVRAAGALRRRAHWTEPARLPPSTALAAWLRDQDDETFLVADGVPDGPPDPAAESPWTCRETYSRPYLMHASIAPSAAMAVWEDGRLTVWTHSQGVYPLRDAIAGALGLASDDVRVKHIVGAGTYGHSGQDDAAFDAVLLAMAVPGRPVLLKWSREDEHMWEPYGPPMVVEVAARVGDDGRIAEWRHDVWSTTHVRRPLPWTTPNFLAGQHLDPPLPADPPEPVLAKEVGMHRNATPIYDIPAHRIVKHFVRAMPLRTSSLRALGAYANVLAIESMMDELAAACGASPLEFRLRHLSERRARDVLEAVAAAAAWDSSPSSEFGLGSGLGFARYKNLAAYAAVLARVRVDDKTAAILVEEVVAAVDCGEVIDPSGVINQIEGGVLQSISWTLKEQVHFNATRVESVDWASYPILRFSEVPAIETVVLDRPGLPFLGVGEAAQGPTAAAIANAVYDAVGLRLRSTPFTPERVQNAALS